MIRENDNKQESSDTVMEQHKSVLDKIEAEFLTCERIVVFVLLMVTAGMMGAYTFVMRGGVFCNAQTANIVMMGIAFGKKNWDFIFLFLSQRIAAAQSYLKCCRILCVKQAGSGGIPV